MQKQYKTKELLERLQLSWFYAKLLIKQGLITKVKKGLYELNEDDFKEFNAEAFKQQCAQIRISKQSKSLHAYMENRTEEQKLEFSKTMSKASTKMWAEADSTFKEAHRQGCIKAQSTEEARLRNSLAQKKRYESIEAHEKLSKAQKDSWLNETCRQNRIAGLQKANAKESVKHNRSTALKLVWQNEDFRNDRVSKMHKAWANEDLRQKQAMTTKLSWKNPEIREKRSAGIKRTFAKPEAHKALVKRIKLMRNRPDVIEKMYQTKKQNNTFNTSSWQKHSKQLLYDVFGENDVIEEYRNVNTYPFKCDFYIKSLDLYIECHYCQYHNYRPFDPSNEEHLKEVQLLKEKSAKLHSKPNARKENQYDKTIKVWTDLDVRKRQCAIDNKLNWLVFYSRESFEQWLSTKFLL